MAPTAIPRRTARTLLALGAVLALLGGPRAAAGVEGPCTASFNGVSPDQIDTLQSPLELKATDVLRFHGTDESGTQSAKVEVVLAMVTVRDTTSAYGTLQSEFSASLDLDDVSPYGVGLYRVRGTTDSCTAEVWIRITGRFPFATLTGLTAGGLALGGFAAQMTAIAARRKRSALLAAAAGPITGLGAAGIAQQFGRLQLSIPSVAIVGAAAAVLGALVAVLLRPGKGTSWWARFRERRGRKRAIRYQARLEAARLDAQRREAELEAAEAPPSTAPGEPDAAVPPDEEGPEDAAVPEPEPDEPAPVVREAMPIRAEPDDAPIPAPDEPAPGGGEPAAAEPSAAVPEPGPDTADPEPEPDPTAAAPSGPAIEGPAWCYVLAPVDVFGLDDHSRTIGTLHPGTWYLAKRQVGGWVQVAVGDGTEGWVAQGSIHRLG